MAAPRYTLNFGSRDKDTDETYISQRNPSYVVAFIRFKEPCAMQAGSKQDAFLTDDLLVVESDCVQITTSSPKGSFAKTASLQMKLGEIWYQNAVSNGDWVFIWMVNSQQDAEVILNTLLKKGAGTYKNNDSRILNDFHSGLKFMGRVIGLSNVTAIQTQSGQYSLGQTVNCQAFLEMANSVYYTYIAKALMANDNNSQQGQTDASLTVTQQNLSSIAAQNNAQGNGMDTALKDIADKFLQISEKSKGFSTPDEIIGILFVLIMGVEKEKSVVNVLSSSGLDGSFGDAIGVPKEVAQFLGRKDKTKLWQLYNVILGMQSYSTGGTQTWQQFSPDLDDNSKKQSNSVFYRTPNPTKGSVPLQVPPIWDNNNLWSVMSNYLNPVVNEMYTCLRVNKDGKIMPTLIVREKPFSTGLFKYLEGKASQFKKDQVPQQQNSKQYNQLKKAVSDTAKNNDGLKQNELKVVEEYLGKDYSKRSFYGNLPRWVVPTNMVKSVNLNLDENRRVNFVQVWGRSSAVEFIQGNTYDQESFKVGQYLAKNFVADEADIARSGLRADIQETPYDIPLDQGGSLANVFARMRADWLFNGHMKPFGTLSLYGVQEPICEGDNLEYEGIVFHITAVSHTTTIAPNGVKTFDTVVQVENGILAESLENKNQVPRYTRDIGKLRDTVNDRLNLPGKTDVQATGARKGRNDNGEEI